MPVLSNSTSALRFPSLEEEARFRAAQGDSESWLFIVPNRVAERRMNRDILHSASGRALPKLHILTLADLAGELATSALPDYRFIGDGESAVLIELAIRELLEEHRLSFFERAYTADSAFPIPRGTFELVVNTIRQLKESGVAQERIASDLQKSETTGETTEIRRARDIHAIYERYQSWLIERNLMDTHGQMLLINERCALHGDAQVLEDFERAFPGARDIFVSGFYYLEQPSIALIARLAKMNDHTVTIELPEHKNNPDLFTELIELERSLTQSGFRALPDHPISKEKRNDSIREHIAINLFRTGMEHKAPMENIEYLAARDAVHEIQLIARAIKSLYESDESLRENLSRIVVATPSPELYTPLIEEIFRTYEIPAQITDRYRLDRAPLVQALLSLLDAARTGLRRRELIRILASPYFSFHAACGPDFNSANLLDLVGRLVGNGNSDSITRTLRLELSEIQERKTSSLDSVEFSRAESEERRIHRALSDLARLNNLLRPLSGEITSKEFCEALRSLLTSLSVRNQILASHCIALRSGTLENDTRAFQALVKLLNELDSLFHIMGIGDKKLPVAFFEQRLKAALVVTRYSTREKNGAVLVTSIAQSISHPAKYLFLAGLVEGAFPVPYQPQVFLPHKLQKGERKQLLEDRVLFYQAITNAASKLFLSWPKHSVNFSTANRSSFLDALDEVLDIPASKLPEGILSADELFRNYSELDNASLESLRSDYAHKPWMQTLTLQLPRSTRAVQCRRDGNPSNYAGILDLSQLSQEELAALDYNKSRVWSVTQLERYAKCAFRFFAHDILALREEGKEQEGLDARERGTALHEVLREFLVSRRERKILPIQDVPEAELPTLYTEARGIAERFFESSSKDDPFWRLDSEALLSDHAPDGGVLWKFIRRERTLQPYELRPRFFEVSFGGSGHAPTSPDDSTLSRDEAVNLGPFKLRGKIDRIDLPRDGDPQTSFAVIDYKSGKEPPRWSEIERGLSLQLPLYLRVAEDLLRSHFPDIDGVAALYHMVMGDERKLGIALGDYAGKKFEVLGRKSTRGLIESKEELAQIIDETVHKAKSYVDGVAEGTFPLIAADLRKKGCAHCPYTAVCRVTEAEQMGVLQ